MVTFLAESFLKKDSSNDVYDWVTAIYGAEWGSTRYSNLIDPTNTIDIVLFDIEGDNSINGGMLGYFWARDNFTKTGANSEANSNEKILFAMDAVLLATPEGASWEESDYWPKEMVSTLAHEFQHMINFYQRIELENMDTWLNELLSLATEDILAEKLNADGPRGVSASEKSAGAALNQNGRLGLFNYQIERPLSYWANDDSVLADYAKSYALGAWVLRNFSGKTALAAIQHADAPNSPAMLETALNRSLANILRQWGTAVLLSDLTNNPEGLRYNSASEFSSGKFSYGAINLWNYSIEYEAGNFQVGPYFVSGDGPVTTELSTMPFQSNVYYRAASNVSGSQTWNVNIPAGILLTVVVRPSL